MKIQILFFCFLFFLTGKISAQDSSKISLSFKEISHDFGTIKINNTVKYIFNFTNTGTDTIKNITFETQCGCTTPLWKKHNVPPNNSDSITVEFFPRNVYGDFEKYIDIYINGNEKSFYSLKVSGISDVIYRH